ncbi:MAG: hypothetical protein KatS3mg078_0759 [Deltaproteobacteria bacterium]|nr:MAG: hypothetical protein KatS3mg078_0759 [Deltaproteobacteria bacterium]
MKTKNLEEVKEALSAGADIIMLDNMPIETIKEALEIIKGRALTEVSGGINLENIRKIAETGVDFISIGSNYSFSSCFRYSPLYGIIFDLRIWVNNHANGNRKKGVDNRRD